ncbi:innexin inx2-like isoform X1 [Parasteatoda tepidariorum]|uniref:innexin inx2-like isoform X1 n=1 Tax=Parasteatoda tepidariorum TaxID=114398 RepID=UPI001C7222E1|nr:innexin inx2-like isoform X1 [Parasteatoda tepidariorum]
MFEIFNDLKDFIKVDSIQNDNNIFRLHYRFTVLVLVGFSILVSCRQYLGDPIDCIQSDDIPENVLETYCWVHSTFTLPDAWYKKVGVEVPHPGIDKYTPGETKKYHSYYQWVCFALFLQSCLFYLPRYMWKFFDSGKCRTLVMGLNCPVLKPEDVTLCKFLLVGYLKTHLDSHGGYITSFIMLEIYNFLNVVAQIFLMDTLFGGQFSTFGFDVISFSNTDQEYRTDPMVKVFPRMTKCTFHRYGSSGDIQRHDALCILPINILNEKIYIFLWFWFIILAVLSGIVLVFRFVLIVYPASRSYMLTQKCGIIDRKDLNTVMKHVKLGDWFVLYLLSKNIDSVFFKELMHEFAEELREGKPNILRGIGKKSSRKGSDAEGIILEPEWDPYDVFVDLTSREFQELYASDEDDI